MWRGFVCRSIKQLRMLHKRALSDSVLELLPEEGQVLDLTCGEGFDASEVLTKTNCKVLGVDWDPSRMPSTTNSLQSRFGRDRFNGCVCRASEVGPLLRKSQMNPTSSLVMLDMGPSREQVKDRMRGMDIRLEGPLDGRYCREEETTSLSEVLATATEETLTRVLKKYGGVVRAKVIAREIVESRYLLEDLQSTSDLMHILLRAHSRQGEFWEEKGEGSIASNIDKTFAALRRFVNDEINEMIYAVRLAEVLLKSGGLLMCHANTEFEENLLKTTIFRDPTSGWRQLMECKNDRHLLLFELNEPNK